MHNSKQKLIVSRRDFLRSAIVTTGGIVASLSAAPVFSAVLKKKERVLSFYNIHTEEKSKIQYWANGHYLRDGIAEINQLLRDHRSGGHANMDTRLLDTLYLMQNRLENHHSFEVISGYRSPETNRYLRSMDKSGVAKRSYHTKGRAIDIRLPGTQLSDLRKVALSTRSGGVGYYPSSNFLHLDTGRYRSWTGRS